MAKRAVLIGINYEGSPIDAPLNGCVNDVVGLRDVLAEKYGFEQESMRVLIDANNDGSYPMPTGQNIIDALTAAVDESQDGDVLLIHYSGHGSQQNDTSGEETDGKDEFLVAYDGVPVTDDVLKGLLARLSSGVRLTMIADCCHSGTMLDQPTQDIEVTGEKSATEDDHGGLPEGAANRSLPTESFHSFVQSNFSSPSDFFRALPGVPDEVGEQLDPENTTSRDWMSSAFDFLKQQAEQAAAQQLQQEGGYEGEQPDFSQQVAPAASINLDHCALISGCEDHQTSADATLDGQPNGALTWGIVTVLREHEGNITYRELIHDVRGKLAEQNFAQNPTLSCADGIADTAFICEI